ncbi:hypothetical protein BGZ50_000748 [Haplosporangium sp. Z 11]|nr:hypothetical protein BGZ50_000748 [Haplosporangium sp. Z 11]
MMANRMHMYTLMNRWLHVRIEFLGGFIVFATATFAVLNVDKLNPSLFGLALSYALNMIGYIDFLVSTISEVQNLLVFVERIKEYSEKPTEASLVTDPMDGGIVFKNYSTRYRGGLDLVLKDASFVDEPAEKVGNVEGAGAGLVLDEATAAVDVETNDLIQKTIRREFKDRTILTIAHRIKTVMDSDKTLVLEKGRVQEVVAPATPMKRKGSLFYSLATQTGMI